MKSLAIALRIATIALAALFLSTRDAAAVCQDCDVVCFNECYDACVNVSNWQSLHYGFTYCEIDWEGTACSLGGQVCDNGM